MFRQIVYLLHLIKTKLAKVVSTITHPVKNKRRPVILSLWRPTARMVGRPVVWPLRWNSQSCPCTGHSNSLELEVCRRVKPPRTSVKLWRRLQSGSRSKEENYGLVCCLNTSQELIIPLLGCPKKKKKNPKHPMTLGSSLMTRSSRIICIQMLFL